MLAGSWSTRKLEYAISYSYIQELCSMHEYVFAFAKTSVLVGGYI